MKKPLSILCLITSCISYSQSNLHAKIHKQLLLISLTLLLTACGTNVIKNGQGTFTLSNGEKYVGEVRDYKWNGQGTYIWPNGEMHVGQWIDGKPNGYGTRTFPSGSKYVGAFKDGNYNGFGTLYNANGSINQQGVWRANALVQAQSPPPVIAPLVPEPINNERKKLEEERRQLAEERRKIEEEKRKLNSKPPPSNPQDNKRQRCINLGLAPNSADFQQCMN